MANRVTHVSLVADVSAYVRDVRTGKTETSQLRREAERFSKGRYGATLKADTSKARTEVSALEKRLQAFGRTPVEGRVNLDTDEARDRLRSLQARLSEFGSRVSDARLGVDDADAQGKISRVEASLLALGRKSADPDIDIEGVAAAEAELAGLTGRLNRFDGRTYEANVRIDGMAQMTKSASLMTDAILMLGPAMIPVAAAAAGPLAAMASGMGAVAAAGGSAALAFSGVGEALTALNEKQNAAGTNAAASAQAQVAAAQQVADARRGVISAERAAADAAREGAQQVREARRGVIEAERDQTAAAREGAREIADAQDAVGDARRDAAQAARDAAQRVADAERGLVDAHRRVEDAELDLHDARRQAIVDLQDLRAETRDNALTVEGAEISLIEARRELARASRDGTSSELDLRSARLRVAEAENRLGDARRDSRRDSRELNEAEREGIRNADGVVDARRNLADAHRGVRDAQREVRNAQVEAARSQQESAEAIQDAVSGVADARRRAAERNAQASRDVADAERALVQASRDAARSRADANLRVEEAERSLRRAMAASRQSLAEQSTEAENLAEKMAALGPAGRQFVRFLQSARPEMQRLQNIAQAGMFPGMEAGIRDLLDLMPTWERIVRNSSRALGQLSREGGNALKDPFWRRFFDYIGDEAHGALIRMGRALGNIGEGLAGLIMGLDPVGDSFSKGLLKMTRSFSQWGRTLHRNRQFQEFVDYVQRVSPEVWSTLGAVADAMLQIAKAAAPVGEVTLPVIRGIATVLGEIADSPAGPVIIGTAVAFATLSRAMRTFEAVKASSMVTMMTGVSKESGKAARGMRALGGAMAGLVGASLVVAGIEKIQDAIVETLPGVNELTNRINDIGRGDRPDLGREFDSLGASIERVNAGGLKGLGDKLWGIVNVDAKSLREARQEIEALDSAMAGLVTTKGPRQAQRQFHQLAVAQELSKREQRALLNEMPMFREALEGTGTDADKAARGLTAAERATMRLGRELGRLSRRLEGRQSLRDYRNAIRDFNQQLRRSPDNMRRGSRAWDDTAEKLDGIAAGALAVAEQMRGANKVQFLQKARRDFVDAATKMLGSRKAAERLADRLGLVNQRGKIQIQLREKGLDEATQKLRRLKERADDIPRNIDARVKGNTGDADRDLGVTAKKLRDLDNTTAVPKADLNKRDADRDVSRLLGDLRGLDNQKPTPKADLDDREARRKTRGFAGWFKQQLRGVKDEPVDIDLSSKAEKVWKRIGKVLDAPNRGMTGPGQQEFYEGGYTGPYGTRQVAGVVHGDEHVTRSRSRRKFEAKYPGRLDYINKHGDDMPGYEDGGRVAIGPNFRERGTRRAVDANRRVAQRFAGIVEQRLAARTNELLESMVTMGAFPHDYRRRSFRGVTLDRRTILMVRAAERLLAGRSRFNMSQGSYNAGGVAASGGTHDGGGAFDAGSPFSRSAIIALRRVGFAAWRRYPNQGPWSTHIHSIDPGNRRLSAAAQGQAQDFRSGGDGLGGRDYEPRPKVMVGGFRLNLGGSARRYGGGVRGIVRSIAAQRGWDTGHQWRALSALINSESGWRPNAENPSTTASGLFQFVDGTWASYKRGTRASHASNASVRDQSTAGMRYIKARYGGPIGAWRFKQANNWYDNGGWFDPDAPAPTPGGHWWMPDTGRRGKGGRDGVNRSGKPEAVFSASQWATLRKAITALTMNRGRPVTTEWLERMISPAVKDIRLLHREFVKARDHMRAIRVRTERAERRLDRVRDTERFERKSEEFDAARKAFKATRSGEAIGEDIAEERGDVRRSLRRARRSPIGRDALRDYHKAVRDLEKKRTADVVEEATRRTKWRRREAREALRSEQASIRNARDELKKARDEREDADTKAERRRARRAIREARQELRQARRQPDSVREKRARDEIERANRRIKNLGEEAKEIEKLEKARDRAGRQSDAVRELVQSRKKIEDLREERKERRELAREARKAGRVDILMREQRAEERLTERIKAQKEARKDATKAAQAYRAAQEAAIESTRAETESLRGGLDLFGGFISPRGAQRQVDLAITRITDYAQNMAELRRLGVSPFLLEQLRSQGPTEQGVRLGNALLRDKAALMGLSQSTEALHDLTARVGAVTGDPRFLTTMPWNPTGAVSTRTLNVDIKALDISAIAGEIRRHVRHEIDAALSAGAI